MFPANITQGSMMQAEIKCPKCGEVFVVDESGYAQIVQQIRDKEFEKEIKRREKEIEEKKKSEYEILSMQQKEERNKELSDIKIKISEKDKEIECLKEQMNGKETEKSLR